MKKSKTYQYPSNGEYRGFKVDAHPRIYVRISEVEYRRFIDAKLDLGMSAREAIESGKIICKICIESNIYPKKPSND